MIVTSNGCQNGPNFDANSMPTKKIVNIIKNNVFLICKTSEFIIKTMFFFFYCAGFVHKRNSYQQSSKLIPKSIGNQSKIRARNNYTKI